MLLLGDFKLCKWINDQQTNVLDTCFIIKIKYKYSKEMSHLTTFYIQSIVLIYIHKTFEFSKLSAIYYSQHNIPLQQNPARLPSINF